MIRNAMTASQVATRLGVKRETVYAYVSRGVLSRTLDDDGRSLFETSEVEQIARRGRPRNDARRVGTVDVSLATSITQIQNEDLCFRGHRASELAARHRFEAVAELLWSGTLSERLEWPALGPSIKVARAANAALPATSAPLERFAVASAALSTVHPLRADLRPISVSEHARVLLTTFAAILPPLPRAKGAVSRETRARGFAARLWPRLSPLPVTPARAAVLDAALVLLADHELATSTLAARVAASTRADPFAVVLAGLGALSGPLHGKAALGAHQLLLDAASSAPPELAVARLLEQSRRVPGFGHPVYRGIDPRAACLLEKLAPLIKPSDRLVIDTVSTAASNSFSAKPNVDFALGAFAFATRMPLLATEAIFAIARTAGWIAHALEEYEEEPLRFRARAIYIGMTQPGSRLA
jgi:citrate synthase